jgi:hypothetical protein
MCQHLGNPQQQGKSENAPVGDRRELSHSGSPFSQLRVDHVTTTASFLPAFQARALVAAAAVSKLAKNAILPRLVESGFRPLRDVRTLGRLSLQFLELSVALHAIGFKVSTAMVGGAAFPALGGLLADAAGLDTVGWCGAGASVVLLCCTKPCWLPPQTGAIVQNR